MPEKSPLLVGNLTAVRIGRYTEQYEYKSLMRLRLIAGAALWAVGIQYYIVQLIAASAWHVGNSYSWRFNTISDLANTHCGLYGSKLVCSPLHPLMNASFMVIGVTIIGGALMLNSAFHKGIWLKVAFGCMALTGAGSLLVGLFPENTVSQMHILGAGLSFVFGNIGLILFGVCFKVLPKVLRSITVLIGVLALVALILFLRHDYFGLGIGGMERIVDYPQSIWMILIGLLLIFRNRNSSKV